MSKYIDADLLLENLKKQYGEELGWQCTVNMSDVGMMIEDAPAVDVVAVVRCKDCKYLDESFGYVIAYCSLDQLGGGLSVNENGYCDRGVRR